MPNFSSSPAFGNAHSFSYTWPSRYRPADDGSCGENVAVAVLEAFDIPYIGSPPPRGHLCGMDINNMAAADAINLSLAENMKDGNFYELYTNADGFAYFEMVYPEASFSTLDIRTCVPTSNIDQRTDLVIVRGYDTPPVRSFKDFVELDWLETDSLSNYVNYCPMFSTEAWRSYKDPVLETAYKDGVENLYELQEFENLLGYVIDFDGEADPNIKYSFSNTTLKNVYLDYTNTKSFGGSSEVCDESGSSSVRYSGFTSNVDNYMTIDKFGEPWPLLMGIQGVYAIAHNVNSVTYGPFGSGSQLAAGVGPYRALYNIERKAKFVSLPATNWHWTLNDDSSASVHIYSRTPIEGESNYGISDYPGLYMWSDETRVVDIDGRSIGGLGGIIMPNMGGSWVVLLRSLWAVAELDRPSVHVTDPGGKAIQIANALSIRYQPIVVTDTPAPIAYTFGGGAKLVDHTLDLYDSDPSTVQDSPQNIVGSLAWLQTQSAGRTVDVSLPFCDENECRSVANTIFEMQNESINTYNLVCGPTSDAKLGTKVAGFDGRVNRITESFTDSSSYTINVNVGPTFTGARGWGTSIWQRKTEDVSREGVITWSAGDGINYRVKVQGGLGVYHAINKTLAAYNPGEKVKVTIHNNPVEK